jgi:hypothetical protein
LLGAGVAVLVGMVLLLVQGSPERLNTADQLGSVVGAVMGALGVVVAVAGWWAARRSVPADPATLLDDTCEELARQVHRQWEHEAGARGLLRPEPLRVRWCPTGRPVTATEGEVFGPTGSQKIPRVSGDVTEIARLWRQLPARQLVVIGAAGAGKTSGAVLLTLDLLTDRQDRREVPVLLNLAGWDPDREHTDTWLARRLAELYPALGDQGRFGRDAAGRLVDRARIVPVLDGLDEIPAPSRAAAVAALTDAVGRDRPLVLTCRAEEYQETIAATGTPLARAVVVELEPLTGEQASEYLPAGQINGVRRWAAATAHLRTHPNGPLAQALATPLMVYLARTVYTPPHTDPGALTRFTDRAAIEEHLLEAYLPTLYHPRTPARDVDNPSPVHHYPPGEACEWLTFLARHLRGQDGSDLHWWQLVTAVPQPRLAVSLTVGLAYALLIGPVGGLVFGLVYGLTAGQPAGLTAGLLVGPAFGLVAGLRTAAGFVHVTHDAAEPGRLGVNPENLTFGLAVGSAFGLVIGFAVGVVGEPVTGSVVGPAVGLVGGSLGGPVFGLVARFNRTAGFVHVTREVAGPGRLRVNTENLIFGLVYGLVGGLSAGLLAGPAAGFVVGLLTAPVVGLVTGLRFTNGFAVHVTHEVAGPNRLRVHPGNLAFGIVYGLVGWFLAGLVVGPVVGLAVGVVVGLAGGVPYGLRAANRDELLDPRLTLRGDRALFLAGVLAYGVAFGLMGGVVGALVYGLGGGLSSALGIGLVGGLGAGLVGGFGGAWIRFAVARLWLGAGGHLPWRVMRFLDDAHRRGVLRQVGAAYQFRHARLQDHLTGADRTHL